MAQHAWAPEFVRRGLENLPSLRGVVQWLEAAWLALVWATLGLLPPAWASRVSAAFLRRVGPRLRKHRHVQRNLAIALPERSQAEREAIAREVWAGLGAVFGELPHLGRIDGEAASRIETEIHGRLAALEEPPRPVVFVTAHLGNWEVTTLAAARYGVPISVIYSPDANPWVDRLIRRHRKALRCELVAKQGGLRALLRALAAGRSLGFLIDTRQDDGELVPFFGTPALTTTVPARLALRAGLQLVPLRCERTGPARFRIDLGPAIEPDPAIADPREQARDMTRRVNERFEAWIRERPEQWLCTKRRWPKERRPAS
ncbi:MAG: lauroyl acyltransferase [Deltaproteobacteria bacterium]|nr:lauroyl acyltransferase [Deltaproteobacteria bacterium]